MHAYPHGITRTAANTNARHALDMSTAQVVMTWHDTDKNMNTTGNTSGAMGVTGTLT